MTAPNTNGRAGSHPLLTDARPPDREPYPKPSKFFAYRFMRLMARVCLANEIGPEACWLLTIIANTEDAKRYRDAVTYFNENLINVTGFGSVPSLARFRAK